MPSGIASINRNADGTVSRIVADDGITVDFVYHNVKTRADEVFVEMTVLSEKECVNKVKLILNSQGFANKATLTDYESAGEEPDVSEWEFSYNDDGQLIKYKCKSYRDDEYTITYSNGDIISVNCDSEESWDSFKTSVQYTNSVVTKPIENIGGVMLWDDCFDVDLDEFEFVYYAGLLGKGTKHLPVSYREDDGQDDWEEVKMEWSLNASQLPTMVKLSAEYYVSEKDWTGTWDDEVSFKW